MTLTEFFRQYSHLAGEEIRAQLEANSVELMADVDAKIAALTGADSNINAFLDQVRSLLDADTGTEGYQQGVNLFDHIAGKYAALTASLGTTNSTVATLNSSVADFMVDLSALMARVSTLEGATAVLRSDVDAVKVTADGIVGSLASAFADISNQMAALRAGLRGEAQPAAGN